jgi:hypothetical protein
MKWTIEPGTLEMEGFTETLTKMGLLSTADEGAIFLGSIAQAQETKHIVFCNFDKLDCRYYYPRFGINLLNSDYIMLPFGDVMRFKVSLFDIAGRSGYLFGRPSGIEAFEPKVFDRQTFDKEMKSLKNMEPEDLLLFAPPVNIKREWRCVVVENRIVASAQFKQRTKDVRIKGAPPEVVYFGQRILDEINYSPDPVWTLDLCELEAGDLRISEVGGFSCSKLFNIDPTAVIEAVNAIKMPPEGGI